MISPLDQSWTAFHYDGITALRREVTLRLSGDGVRIIPAGEEERLWPFGELLQVSGEYSGEPLRFERSGPQPREHLVVEDDRFREALRQYPQAALRSGDVTASLVGWRRVIVLMLVVGLVAALLYSVGRRAFAGVAVRMIPVRVEERMGEAAVRTLIPSHTQCRDDDLEAALNQIAARLSGAIDDSPYTYRITIAREPSINAFAAPGGYIVVYAGLIEQADKPEHVAAVLAHEMQHVQLRHSTRALLEQYSGQALISLMAGDSTSTPALMQGAAALADLHYRREDENAADHGAVELLRAARIDPQAMVEFFELIEERGLELPDAISYLSTHPQAKDRITAIREAGAARSGEATPLLPDVDWAAVKMACRAK
jgi:Zn-dependent protease with chaperone function